MEEKREQFIAAEIRSLNVKIEAAELIVEMAETAEHLCVHARCGPDDIYESSFCDGTLLVRLGIRQPLRLWPVVPDSPRLTLLLPPGLAPEIISLEVGAGNANLRQAAVTCRSFSLDTSAGNTRLGRLDVKESLKVTVGAGNVKLDRMRAKDVRVDCGVGNFSMRGQVLDSLDLGCGVGKCTILLEGKQSDYDYDISCGIGRVSVNGQPFRRLRSGKHARTPHGPQQDNPQQETSGGGAKSAAGKIRIDCGVGNVTLKTSEL